MDETYWLFIKPLDDVLPERLINLRAVKCVTITPDAIVIDEISLPLNRIKIELLEERVVPEVLARIPNSQ